MLDFKVGVALEDRNLTEKEWRRIMAEIVAAQQAGVAMKGQVLTRPTGVLLGFEISQNPFLGKASWKEIEALPFAEKMEHLRDPAFRKKLIEEPADHEDVFTTRVMRWDRIFKLGDPPNYEPSPEESVKAEALANNTTASRIKRHLRMAKILQTKGRFDSAVAEVRKAQALDPSYLEPVLELGELLCRAGKGKDALETVRNVQAAARRDRARLLLISGWAKRQMGDLNGAEKDLIEATKLDPKSTRGCFELGQVYRAKGDKDKALAAYHRALTLVLGDS